MWQQNQGSPIGGVVLHEYDARTTTLTNQLDKADLLPFAAVDAITDLGSRDLYSLTHEAEVPFAIPNIKAGTVVQLDSDEYTFSLPQFSESVTTIVSVSTTDIVRGDIFELVASNGKLGAYGSRISPSLTQPYVIEVVGMDKINGTENVRYQMIYKGNVKGEDKLPGDVLQVGRPLYKISATRSSEFGQNYDGWEVSGGINRKFISRISNNEIQTHYKMTREACKFSNGMFKDKQWVTDNLTKAVEFIGIKNPLDPSIKTWDQYLKAGNAGTKSELGFRYLSMLYDKISIGILNQEEQNQMVWDPGSATGTDGHDQSYIHPGVWHQMEYSGYKHTFNVETATKEMLMAAIREYESGKKIQPQINQPRTYVIKTGDGGLRLLQKWFRDEYVANVTAQVYADKLKQYEGDYRSGIDVYSAVFNSITIDMNRYTLRWEYDASLNPTKDYAGDNPLVGGYRLSSYAMIIEDADFSASNIKILRNKAYNGGNMDMFVINHNMAHPLYQATNNGIPVHQATSTGTGFEAYFTARPDTAIVWDPTRMLRLIPINNRTGRAIY